VQAAGYCASSSTLNKQLKHTQAVHELYKVVDLVFHNQLQQEVYEEILNRSLLHHGERHSINLVQALVI